VPKQICVTVEDYSSGDSSTTTFLRDCTADGEIIVYSGTVIIDGAEVDLAFIFKVENETCYICLRSVDLGVDGTVPDDCHVVGPTERGAPDYFCWRFGASWTVGNLTISISAAHNIAIENRSDCVDSYGNVVPDENPIRNVCGGCGCICECACIITFGDNRQAVVETACLSGTTTYRTYSGVEIELTANYETGCCELELVDTPFALVEESLIFPAISIGGNSNPCPSPEALFSAFTEDGDAIFFYFICSPCGDCPVIPTTCCDTMPLVLTATVTTSCPDCGSFQMSLVWDGLGWLGEQSEGFCGHPISLRLSCSGYTWNLIFSGNPCTGSSATATGSCDPILLSFNLGTLGGIGCCGGSSVLTPTVSVTITE